MYGSREIHKRAGKFGIKNKLIEIENGGHEPQIDYNSKFTTVIDTIKNVSKNFLFDIISTENGGIYGDTLVYKDVNIYEYNIPYQSGYRYVWSAVGGVVVEINKTGNQAKIAWFDNAENHSIRLSIINKLGAVTTNNLEITLQ